LGRDRSGAKYGNLRASRGKSWAASVARNF
jgi:hypothetical protein